MSSARSWTRTTRSRVERTNHEATAPPQYLTRSYIFLYINKLHKQTLPTVLSIWNRQLLFLDSTVPLKGKLTVSTRNLILEVFENRESSFENRVSRIEFQGSSFEFRDTRRIFRGSWTEILRKQFNSRKQNNSDEQNNWRAALFAQTRFECMQIFFRVVHFLQGTCGSHIYTEADNSKTANLSSSHMHL